LLLSTENNRIGRGGAIFSGLPTGKIVSPRHVSDITRECNAAVRKATRPTDSSLLKTVLQQGNDKSSFEFG
jgi:hypothetical protein